MELWQTQSVYLIIIISMVQCDGSKLAVLDLDRAVFDYVSSGSVSNLVQPVESAVANTVSMDKTRDKHLDWMTHRATRTAIIFLEENVQTEQRKAKRDQRSFNQC